MYIYLRINVSLYLRFQVSRKASLQPSCGFEPNSTLVRWHETQTKQNLNQPKNPNQPRNINDLKPFTTKKP